MKRNSPSVVSAFFAAQAIKIDDDNDETTRDDSLPKWIHIQQVGAVIDRCQDKGPEQGAVNRPDRTKKAGTADDGRSDSLQFPSFSRGGVTDPDPCGKQNPDKGGSKGRVHVGDVNNPDSIYA